MAFDNENVLFGAELDPTNLKKGATEIVAALQLVANKQKDVQEQFQATSTQLKYVETELAKTSTEYNNLSKNSKDYVTTSTALKARIDDLQKQNQTLSTTYKKQGEELAQLNKVNQGVATTMTQLQEQQRKVQEVFGKKVTANVDISMLNQANTKLGQLKANFEKVLNPQTVNELFDPKQIDLLLQHVASGKGEFEQFVRMVDALTASLMTVEPGTKEFEQLSEAIKAGKTVIQEYTKLYSEATNVVEKSEPVYKSVRTRLQELRNELTRLEEAGEDETEQYRETQIAAAKLTDQYGDMQQQIRILASDTKNLDFGLSALNAVGAGFEATVGALELFGVSTDTAEEAQRRLLSIMALVQGAQQLQNLLLKEGVIRTVGANLATQAYAATQRLLAVTLGATAAASRTLATALIATGVGALVVALGFLIAKVIEWTSATDDAEKAQARLNDEIEHQNKLLAQDFENIDFNTKIRNEKLKQRGLSEQAIFQSNQQGLKEKMAANQREIDALNANYSKTPLAQREAVLKQIYKLEDESRKLALQLDEAAEVERTRIVQNGFKKRKEIADKAKADTKAGLDLLDQIRKELALRGLGDEQKELLQLKFEFDKQFKQLQAARLSTLQLEELYEGKRNDVKSKYSKMRMDEEKRIFDELEKLSFDQNERRIANLTDTLERERAQIKSEQDRSRAELQANQTVMLDQLLDDKVKGLITPAMYSETVAKVNAVFDKLFEDIDEKAANDYRALGERILQNTIQGMEDELAKRTNTISIETNIEVTDTAKLYLDGKISYEKYQKELTRISREENFKRLEITKTTISGEMALIEQRLKGKINNDERKALERQLSDLKKAYSDAEKAQVEGQVENNKKIQDGTNEHLQKVLAAYSAFSSSVVGFLNAITDAENARLDRSIALQEKRVDNARELAEKGNAEYLELEQKRLDELTAKREANARKQMAINQALTASQALVAAIGAIANASSEGGIIAAIAAGAAIVAAIASMYQFVSTLQAPVAEFFEGTLFVQGKEGRDKIPSKLTKGEAVIPVDRNKEYHETVKAIYQREVPANILNSFVTNYPSKKTEYNSTVNKYPEILNVNPLTKDMVNFVNNYPSLSMPSVDYSRMGLATEKHIEVKMHPGLSDELNKLNGTMEQVVDKLDKLEPVHLSLDQNGFAVSFIRAIRSEKLKWLN